MAAESQRQPEEPATAAPDSEALRVRLAGPEDAGAVSAILAEAFPGLYRATFGRLDAAEIARLLQALYRAGTLSLDTTLVCERASVVAGLAILHTGPSVGRGSAGAYWRAVYEELGLLRGLRAFFGGLSANAFLNQRIPRAPDLVYIEALAVAEPVRGCGIGTLLLEDAVRWTRACPPGRSRLALHVLYSNTGARRLYERMGFRPWNPRQRQWTRGSALLMLRKV
ncbi:MAG TPA: GNAT family N-acetyltransferase [Chthonomonadaceae bacterium]|nr:GNAT family N-acetyltransferase [Chthonomonadaceae bacterium]